MFSYNRKGALRSLILVLPSLAVVIFGHSVTAKLLGLGSALVFIGFAALIEFGSRPERELPEDVVEKLERIPATRAHEHKVDLVLDNGSVAFGVLVYYGKYVELPFGRARLRFDPKRVVNAREMKS